MSDMSTVTVEQFGLLDRFAIVDEPLGQPTGEQATQCLALLLTIDDCLLQEAQPAQRTFLASARATGERQEQ